VVNRSAKRARLFETDRDYAAFEQVLRTAVARVEVALFAYCVMPNHWHLVLSPKADGALSSFMHWLTLTHARRWQTARQLDGHGAVYQGRFKAVPIETDRHFLWVCRYVERNALRAALVERAEDWPWSSLHSRSELSPELSQWPVSRPLGWAGEVNRPQTAQEVEAFRKSSATGEPFGNDDWRHRLLRLQGLDARRPRGRPPSKHRQRCPP
jgi:putative transposase